jgi:hypothetical protein
VRERRDARRRGAELRRVVVGQQQDVHGGRTAIVDEGLYAAWRA